MRMEWRLAKTFKKAKKKLYSIKNKGEVLTTPSEIIDRWKEYFRELLNVEGDDVENDLLER